ncbi:MAG: acyl-CoA dehydrogenase family protein, partial [Candidatus Xenobia bacterium]
MIVEQSPQINILERAATLGSTWIGPHAEAIDRGEIELVHIFSRVAEAGLAGLAVPTRYGGIEATPAVQQQMMETLASWCGVTALTHAQHQSACRA